MAAANDSGRLKPDVLKPAPATVAWLTVRPVPPVFPSTIVWLWVVPVCTLVKLRLLGPAVSCAPTGGVVSLPLLIPWQPRIEARASRRGIVSQRLGEGVMGKSDAL